MYSIKFFNSMLLQGIPVSVIFEEDWEQEWAEGCEQMHSGTSLIIVLLYVVTTLTWGINCLCRSTINDNVKLNSGITYNVFRWTIAAPVS